MFKRITIAAVAALSLSACAEAPTTWYKDGVTQQSFAGDEMYCMAQARAAGGHSVFVYGGVGVSRPNADKRTYQLCMVSRGYTTKDGDK